MGRDHDRGHRETFGKFFLYLIYLLVIYQVDFVDCNKCGNIYTAPHYLINQVFLRGPAPDEDIRIHDFTFAQDRPDFLNIQFKRADLVDTDTPV